MSLHDGCNTYLGIGFKAEGGGKIISASLSAKTGAGVSAVAMVSTKRFAALN